MKERNRQADQALKHLIAKIEDDFVAHPLHAVARREVRQATDKKYQHDAQRRPDRPMADAVYE